MKHSILKNNLFHFLLIFFLISTLLFSSAKAEGGVPSVLSYQGRLTDSSGNLLGNTGTPYFFKFSFWDSPTLGAGSQVWPVVSPSSVSLTVKQGVFNVNLGDTENGYPDTLNYNFNTNKKIYLQIEVSSNNSSFETLSPRQRITSSAFAEIAGQVNGVGQSSFGTTTPTDNSIVTIQSTSSVSTALTLLASTGQLSNIFNIFDSNNNSIFSINNSGGLFANYATTTNFFSNYLNSTNSNFENSTSTNLFASSFKLSNLNGLLFGDNGVISSVSTSSIFSNYYNKVQSDGLYDFLGTASTTASTTIANHENLFNHNLIATALQSFTESDPIFMSASTSLSYIPLSASTSLNYIKTESDPFWNLSSTSLSVNNFATSGISQWLNDSGYLTSFTETDPIYTSSSWSTTTNNSTDWNTAFGWGSHNGLYDLLGTASTTASSTLSNWLVLNPTSGINTGDNATNTQYSGLAVSKQEVLNGTGFVKANGTSITYDNNTYLTAETDPLFTAWDKHAGISVTESQISDLKSYLTAESDTLATITARNASTSVESTFSGGLVTNKIRPVADSSNAIQITKADGITNVLNIDTTNGMVGIGTTNPTNMLDVGSITNGGNMAVYGTEGAEIAPALEATNWTVTGSASAGSGTLTFTGAGTATPSGTFTVTPGRFYKIVVTLSSSGYYTYASMGGSPVKEPFGTATYTIYVLASSNAKIVFTTIASGSGNTTITSLSIKEMTPNTGDFTAYGKLKIVNGIFDLNGNRQIDINSSGAVGIGTGASNSGYKLNVGGIMLSTGYYGPFFTYSGVSYLRLDEQNYTASIRNTTNQSILRVYNTYTNASNYERFSLTGVAGANVNLTAETAGTGADNLNIVLTPSGTGYTLLNGNVGIGTSAPTTPLHIKGAHVSGYGVGFFEGTGNDAMLTVQADGVSSASTAGLRLKVNNGNTNEFFVRNVNGVLQFQGQAQTGLLNILPDGNVGIGTTTPSAKLHITGTAGSSDIFVISSSTNSRLFTVGANGNVGIGTTTPFQVLSVVGNAQFTAVGSGASANDLRITDDGTLTTSASDIALKMNFVSLVSTTSTSTLDKVLSLKPYSFNWKVDPEGKRDIGLIAQDVQDIFPEITFTNKVDGYMGINYSRLPVILISAIQELNNKLIQVGSYVVDGVASFVSIVTDKFVANEADIKNIKTEKICLGETCIDEQSLKDLLQKNSIATVLIDDGQTDGENSTSTATSTEEEIATSTATTTDDTTIQATSTETVSEEISTSTDIQLDTEQSADEETEFIPVVADPETI